MKIVHLKIMAILLGIMVLCAASAQATVYEMETFDPGWTMGAYGWSQDRSMPAVVEATNFDGGSRLHIGLDGSETFSDSFYRTQGINRVLNLPAAPVQTLSVDLYLGSDWGATDSRYAGLWARGADSSDVLSAWSILQYRSGDGIAAGFYTYDYIGSAWDLHLATDASDYGAWHNLSMTLHQGTGIEYFVDGVSLGLFADTLTFDLTNAILNTRNYGENADYYYDNLTASATPIPGAVWLLGTGLLGLVGLRRKIRS